MNDKEWPIILIMFKIIKIVSEILLVEYTNTNVHCFWPFVLDIIQLEGQYMDIFHVGKMVDVNF